MNNAPKRYKKVFFWLILSALSVFFAEVISGSYIFPFSTPWGWIAVVPLYGLHLLVIGYVVYRGRPNLWLLFVGGIIFGLYEAYITKVLWIPSWGDPTILIAEISIVEFIVLVFWWHPLFSFILPLFSAELLLTGSSEIFYGFPKRLKEKLVEYPVALPALFFIWAGLMHGGSSPSIVHSLGSSISVFVFIFILAKVWQSKFRAPKTRLRSLMPNKKEVLLLSIPLAVIYILMGIFMRPEIFPGILGHGIILVAYIISFMLLGQGIKRSKRKKPDTSIRAPRYSWKHMYTFALLFMVSSALWSLTGLGAVMLILSWFPGIAFGLFMVGWSVKKIFG